MHRTADVLSTRVGDLEAALASQRTYTTTITSTNNGSLGPARGGGRRSPVAEGPPVPMPVPVRTPRAAVSPPSTAPPAAPSATLSAAPAAASAVAPFNTSEPLQRDSPPQAMKLSDFVLKSGLGNHPLGAFIDSGDAAAGPYPLADRCVCLAGWLAATSYFLMNSFSSWICYFLVGLFVV